MDAGHQIERLLAFGRRHKMLKELDVIAARNTLLDLLALDAPYTGPLAEEDLDTPTEILEPLLDDAARRGLFDNSVPQYRINFEARIMGALMPRPSECARHFARLYKKKGPQAATDWFYGLCIASNYIRTAQIAQNLQWQTDTPYGRLELTINLTKPEKDPKTIALERLQPQSGYPACMLCKENMGYAGRVNFPARQTHRLIPLDLAGTRFYLQYSPYVYFNEHCILLHQEHRPMAMDRRTLEQIFAFVQQFPHYTCGSNADLPIVGGSILSHSHFQGGRYVFPMTRAAVAVPLQAKQYPHLRAGILHWPVSAVRLCSKDPCEVLDAAETLMDTWKDWSDESADILARTGDTPHNTITPILRWNKKDGYILDVVPRNNRTSAQYPDGIFHPHPEYHNIKKENIGLIEVMGLAILPSRLKLQSEQIAAILCGQAPNTSREPGSPLAQHADWIDRLVQKHGCGLTPAQAAQVLQDEIGLVFCHVLENAGVFKQTEVGLAAFLRYLAAAGFEKKPAAQG